MSAPTATNPTDANSGIVDRPLNFFHEHKIAILVILIVIVIGIVGLILYKTPSSTTSGFANNKISLKQRIKNLNLVQKRGHK
jgi:hypothetical protein